MGECRGAGLLTASVHFAAPTPSAPQRGCGTACWRAHARQSLREMQCPAWRRWVRRWRKVGWKRSAEGWGRWRWRRRDGTDEREKWRRGSGGNEPTAVARAASSRAQTDWRSSSTVPNGSERVEGRTAQWQRAHSKEQWIKRGGWHCWTEATTSQEGGDGRICSHSIERVGVGYTFGATAELSSFAWRVVLQTEKWCVGHCGPLDG